MKICSRKAQKIINKDGVKGKIVIGDSSDFVLVYCPPGIKVRYTSTLAESRKEANDSHNQSEVTAINKKKRKNTIICDHLYLNFEKLPPAVLSSCSNNLKSPLPCKLKRTVPAS